MINNSIQLAYQWIVRAAWAPIAVVLIQQLFSRSTAFDYVMHFFGGAAMGFFVYQGVVVFDSDLGRPFPIVRHLLAFGLTCGVVIAWEVGELMSDRFLGSTFQASATETTVDQFCGVVGSTFILLCIALIDRFMPPSTHPKS